VARDAANAANLFGRGDACGSVSFRSRSSIARAVGGRKTRSVGGILGIRYRKKTNRDEPSRTASAVARAKPDRARTLATEAVTEVMVIADILS